MGLGWICCFVEKLDCIVSAGLNCVLKVWIVSAVLDCWIWIVSTGLAGLDRLDWIGS